MLAAFQTHNWLNAAFWVALGVLSVKAWPSRSYLFYSWLCWFILSFDRLRVGKLGCTKSNRRMPLGMKCL